MAGARSDAAAAARRRSAHGLVLGSVPTAVYCCAYRSLRRLWERGLERERERERGPSAREAEQLREGSAPNNSPLLAELQAAMQGPEPVAGIVALADKVVPTEDLPPERQPRECCLSYGAVPFEPLRERMLAQPETFWDDRAQAKENVLIARPFHDNLGVNKVIFLFSDTGARPQVFQLPM